MRTRLLRDKGLKQDAEKTMVEREGISEIKASVDVDIFRDTALRYLGKEYIYLKKAFQWR